MMTQEDGFVEVKCTIQNRTPILKWVRPVIIKKLQLLFDVYCMMIVSKHSDLDFSDIENMDSEEYLAWMVYAGYLSHAALSNKRPRITVEDAVVWVAGMMRDQRLEIYDTIQLSKEIGQIAESYQKARTGDESGGGKKKVGPLEQRS